MTADDIVPSPGSSKAFNRYSYVYNNPVNFVDPGGHFPWLAVIGAIIGGASAGVQSYQESGKVNFSSIAMGAVMGGLSGYMLDPSTTAASLKIAAFTKTSMFLLKTSASMHLASRVTQTMGLTEVSNIQSQISTYCSYAFTGLHVGIGIANWIHDPRFQNVRVSGEGPANAYQSGDAGYVNGILTPLDKAIEQAKSRGASMLSYNPTSSPIADLTETLLEKLTFTGSVERQLIGSLGGLSGIQLMGFSQGGIIASNVSLGLGLMDQRNVISQLKVVSTQISQIRVGISGAVGGGLSFGNKTIVYGAGSPFDFSNALGPNIRPEYFLGGIIGLSIPPVGVSNHRWQY